MAVLGIGPSGVVLVVGWWLALAACLVGSWWLARRVGEEPGAPRRPRADRRLALLACTVTLAGAGIGALETALVWSLRGSAVGAVTLVVAVGMAAGLLALGRRHPVGVLVAAAAGTVAVALVGVRLAATSASVDQWQARSLLLGVFALLPGVVALLGVRRPLPAGALLLTVALLGWAAATRVSELLAGDVLAGPLPAALLLASPGLWGALLFVLAAVVGRRLAGPGRASQDEPDPTSRGVGPHERDLHGHRRARTG